METKKIILLIYVITFGLIVVSCCSQKCNNLSSTIEKELLSTKSLEKYIKYYSKNEVYLLNPIDNEMVLDFNNLYYYKNFDSSYFFVFDSSLYLDKFFIVIIHNGIIEKYQCGDVYQICEIKKNDCYSIEVKDSVLQFNSLSYGVHKINFFFTNDSISYKYEDMILY
jgi:hypothetical protein